MNMNTIINHKFENVSGGFDMFGGKIACVPSAKYSDVDLCFKTNPEPSQGWNIPFAEIRLHTKDLYCDKKAVYGDAVRLGDEIERRWNAFEDLMEALEEMLEGVDICTPDAPEPLPDSIIGKARAAIRKAKRN